MAAALGDNENFATDVATSIGLKLPLAGGTLTGGLIAPSLQLGADVSPTLTGNSTYLKIATVNGNVDIGAGNSSYLHIMTDRPQFYFDKRLVVDEGIVQSYDEDLNLNRAGSTTARLRVTAGTTISDQNFQVDAGTSSTLSVKCDDAGVALIRASGDSQGTGAVEVGQSDAYGGGMSYNGDGSPGWVSGETADHITFYRLSAGTRTEVFHYPYSGNDVIFEGAITAAGNVTAYSDERLKENIQTLDGKKVLQMRGVSFTKDGEFGSGVIAQELEKVAPELVQDGKYKSVAYGNITGYLIEAIKEQQKEIDELKSLVKQLLEK